MTAQQARDQPYSQQISLNQQNSHPIKKASMKYNLRSQLKHLYCCFVQDQGTRQTFENIMRCWSLSGTRQNLQRTFSVVTLILTKRGQYYLTNAQTTCNSAISLQQVVNDNKPVIYCSTELRHFTPQ